MATKSSAGGTLLSVPHVQQRHSWDCGLACSQMVLKFLGLHFDDFQTVCSRLDFGTSVWTIDLAHIMAYYKVPHMFMTLTLGVDKGYSSKSFYKSSFTHDETRVNKLFDSPESLGITLNKCSVTTEELKQHLDSGNIAIFLVDWSRLDCRRCNRRCFMGVAKCISPYQGHYIVVVGYSNAENLIYYRNPSYRDEVCCCKVKTFDSARKSYGTDEDALFIYSEEKSNGLPAAQDLSS